MLWNHFWEVNFSLWISLLSCVVAFFSGIDNARKKYSRICEPNKQSHSYFLYHICFFHKACVIVLLIVFSSSSSFSLLLKLVNIQIREKIQNTHVSFWCFWSLVCFFFLSSDTHTLSTLAIIDKRLLNNCCLCAISCDICYYLYT